jgi:predicted nucleic acid-binding protein
MRVYLDLCTIQRPFDDPKQRRIRDETQALYRILERVRAGTLELVASFALDIEGSAGSDPVKRGYTLAVLDLADERLQLSAVVQRRADAYKEQGLKGWDAMHLAVAVEARVDFLCTCDDQFLRRARAVDTGLTRAVSMLELIEEVDK